MFFFGKKNQKTFVCLAAVLLGGASGESAQALFSRGVALDNGKAVRPDAAAAFSWYKLAAEAGSSAGAFNVGVMFDSGRGAAHDSAKAAFWYAVAASEGEGRGAYNLGELYESGDGVPRNEALAAAWFRRASALGIDAGAAKARGLRDGGRVAPAKVTTPPAARVTALTISALSDATSAFTLVWTIPASRDAPTFFVEVASLAGSAAKDVFTTMTPLSAVHVVLPVGDYADRVFTIDAVTRRYTASPWSRVRLDKRIGADAQPQ